MRRPCTVCLAHLQAIQAVGRELARQPVVPAQQLRPKIPLAWPAPVRIAGAVAALLLMSVFVHRSLESRPAQPVVSESRPKSLPQTASAEQPARSSAAPVHASQLADLTLPAFVAPNLRGESLDAHFEAGMKEYAKGNCRGAIAALSQVPAESAEARAAEFYSGACQMRLGDFATASGLLRKVADAGDSPQQEAALFYLAQIALAGNDPGTAHAYLLRTVSLRGDLEGRAREQDRRIAELAGQESGIKRKNPEVK
jgi:tetratricopeptide (TPR) repeat protein